MKAFIDDNLLAHFYQTQFVAVKEFLTPTGLSHGHR